MMTLYFGEGLDKSNPSVNWTAESFFEVLVKGSTKTSARILDYQGVAVSFLFSRRCNITSLNDTFIRWKGSFVYQFLINDNR